jgi:hypothetical protein
MAVSNLYGTPSEPGITKANQSRELMTAAVRYMHQSIPEGDLILADQESSLALAYYYCPVDDTFFMSWYRTNLGQFTCHGHLIVSLSFWFLRPDGLAAPFQKMAHENGLKSGDRVWIFQAGWGGHLIAQLPHDLAQFHCVTPRTFGENITIVPLMVGPDLSPVPQAKCTN